MSKKIMPPLNYTTEQRMNLTFSNLALYVGLVVIEMLIASPLIASLGLDNPSVSTFVATLTMELFFILNTIIIYKLKRTGQDLLPHKAHLWHDIKVGLIWGTAIFFISTVLGGMLTYVYQLVGIDVAPQKAIKEIANLRETNVAWLAALVAVVAAPLGEEFFFRGVVHRTFLKHFKPVVAIIMSGLFFALFHGELIRVPQLWVGGIMLALAYHRSHSLLGSITAHMTMNAIPVLLVMALSVTV